MYDWVAGKYRCEWGYEENNVVFREEMERCRVKDLGYEPFKNDEDRLTHLPESVHEHQWRALVYYWGTRSVRVYDFIWL